MKLKWITGGLGWMFGGPMGALLGYSLGSLFSKADEQEKFQQHYGSMSQPAANFEISLLVLAAYVIKADGKVDQRELDYVRAQFKQMFGAKRAEESFKVFKHIINSDEVSLRQICLQIDKQLSHAQRLQLIHFLYGISMADGHIDVTEVDMIEKIGGYMHIHVHDLASIKAMFFKEPKQYYKILELETTATDNEVKKAYRKMAMKHHPDKLNDLNEAQQKMGTEKFLKIQEAYEAIKKERGLS
jgi:DnaJ like chaperone protein